MDQVRFSKFLKQSRLEKGLTQEELANMLSVTTQAVSKWENGKGYPDVTTLGNLANALGLSIDELMTSQKIDKKDVEIKEVIKEVEVIKERKPNYKLIGIIIGVILLIAICVSAYIIDYNHKTNVPKLLITTINDIYNDEENVVVEDLQGNDVTEQFKDKYYKYYKDKNYYFIFNDSSGQYVFYGRIK